MMGREHPGERGDVGGGREVEAAEAEAPAQLIEIDRIITGVPGRHIDPALGLLGPLVQVHAPERVLRAGQGDRLLGLARQVVRLDREAEVRIGLAPQRHEARGAGRDVQVVDQDADPALECRRGGDHMLGLVEHDQVPDHWRVDQSPDTVLDGLSPAHHGWEGAAPGRRDQDEVREGPRLPHFEVDGIAGAVATGNHRERRHLEVAPEMRDQRFEKAAREITIIV
jgi:hypothetical protein